MKTETIVAVATPPGLGGVAIIRLSGPAAQQVLFDLFQPARPLEQYSSHELVYGVLSFQGEVIDRCLAVLMKGPHSYTGEDVVEFHTHGGSVIPERVVSCCCRTGARLARPGEFTERAFLNGRLDLAQAESVAELIASRTRAGQKLATQNLLGELSNRVGAIREAVLDWLSLLEAEIDFGDEVPELTLAENRGRLRGLLDQVVKVIEEGEVGRLHHRGLETVLVGAPNAGKSTLLNGLVGEDRALVTDIPGTTRDRVEDSVVMEGIRFNLIDTAGLRDRTDDPIEVLGMERSRQALRKADLAVLVVDGKDGWPVRLGQELRSFQDCSWLVVLNKSDLGLSVQEREIAEVFPGAEIVRVSLLKEGSAKVAQALIKLARDLTGSQIGCFSVNQRQLEALESCKECLLRVDQSLDQGMSGEFLCLDLRQAAANLGELLGIDVTEEVLDRIFITFCLGK